MMVDRVRGRVEVLYTSILRTVPETGLKAIIEYQGSFAMSNDQRTAVMSAFIETTTH